MNAARWVLLTAAFAAAPILAPEAFAQAPPPRPPILETTDTVYPGIAFYHTFDFLGLPSKPAGESQPVYLMTIEAENERVRMSATLTLDPRAKWPAQALAAAHGPWPILSAIESDVPSARQRFLFWWYPAGELRILRDDLVDGSAEVTVRIEETTVDALKDMALTEGFANRLALPNVDYDRVLRYARCARLTAKEAGDCLDNDVDDGNPSRWSEPPLPPGKKGDPTFFSSLKDRTTDRLHSLVARWIGRDAAFEYEKDRASRSEPIVLFIGVAGMNQIVLLDCQGLDNVRDESSKQRRCDDYAKPSALTLERADYFWVAYIEDELTPYDTSIDVEFSRSARNRDFEDFDPRVVAESLRSNSAAERVVRIGWRRFHMRDAPNSVQVAFTRQGAGYAARQWVRVFEQRSKWPVVPAASVFVPSFAATRTTTTLTPVYGGAALEPGVLEISQTKTKRWVFLMGSAQWPQLRSRARDASSAWTKTLLAMVPDATAGLADSKTYFTGASWPIPLWADRTALTVGSVWTRVSRPKEGFDVGSRVPLGTPPDAVIEHRWLPPGATIAESIRIGISIELFKALR